MDPKDPIRYRTFGIYKCPFTGTDAIYFFEMYLGVDKSVPAPAVRTELGMPPIKLFNY